jgi:hypothetical protein
MRACYFGAEAGLLTKNEDMAKGEKNRDFGLGIRGQGFVRRGDVEEAEWWG